LDVFITEMEVLTPLVLASEIHFNILFQTALKYSKDLLY